MYRVRINIYISTSKLKKNQNSTTDASINLQEQPPPHQKKNSTKKKKLKKLTTKSQIFSNQGLILFPLILIMEWTLKTPCKGDDNLKIISFFKNIQKHLCYFNFMSSKMYFIFKSKPKTQEKIANHTREIQSSTKLFFNRNSCIVSPSVGTLNTTPIVLRFNVVEFSWLSACVPFYLGFLIIKSLIIVIFHQPYK